MVEAAIFDIDGTLVDSVDLHAGAWQAAFRKFGKDVPFETVRSQIGKGGDQLVPVFFSPDEIARLGNELEACRAELFKRDYLPRVKAFPATRELLLKIRADGRRIALASSSKKDEIQEYKRIARIDDLVDEEVSKDDVEHSKPSPDVFAAALEKLQLRAERAVAIGDSPYDAEAARKINIPTVGVLCGGFPAETLRAAGVVAIYGDLEELLARYGTSPIGR